MNESVKETMNKAMNRGMSVKPISILAASALLLASTSAWANSLGVNANAAMSGGFGLEVFHDNSSVAYVQDNSPQSESVYRAEFLVNPNNISPENGNWRQVIFSGHGPNPRPGIGNCPQQAAFQPVFRAWLVFSGGNGQVYNLQFWGHGNQCGQIGTARLPIPKDQPSRVCMEYEAANANAGRIRLAVVGMNEACPSTTSPSWVERTFSNGFTRVDFVRLGAPFTNNFGRGENGSWYLDDFASFRTLTP
jgi:hypothetical protein